MFVFLVGCLDYKAYDVPTEEEVNVDDLDLIDEIAQIEQEIEATENTDDYLVEGEEVLVETPVEGTEEEVDEVVVEEDVMLPELTEEENLEEVSDEDMSVISVKENEWVKLNVKVTDPDNDKVTYRFTKPLSNNGEWKTNYGDAGEYVVTLSATDGMLTTEKKIKIVVERVNVAPIISGVKDITVREGDTVTFKPTVSDPNKDAVTLTTSQPLKSGTWVTDHTSAGEYEITVLATDGELETVQKFKLSVTDVNVLPEITGLKDVTVKEGEIVKIKPVVSDLDEDEFTVTISEPVGDDGIWETGFTDHGEYVVTVTVDDGKDKVTKKVKVVIEDVNMPPNIVDVSLKMNNVVAENTANAEG